ncbi:MAG: glycosyltransferase [Luteolibacter sp.]
MEDQETIRIFVGSDRSQDLAVPVLEHSIKRNTNRKVEVTSMADLDLPDAEDPRHAKRTNFSFSRFAIPRLCGYKGKAIYLDADMQVFDDIGKLFDLPFDGAKVVVMEDPKDHGPESNEEGKPRVKQCSVMLLDCEKLDWKAEEIIARLGKEYTYEELMMQLCILEESDVKYGIPFEWNSLEHYDPDKTHLIHYTDMEVQPWVSPVNKNGWVWLNEVKEMLANGKLTMERIQEEIDLGYFRPSLPTELQMDVDLSVPGLQRTVMLHEIDRKAGYQMHREVLERNARRLQAVQDLESPPSVVIKQEAPAVVEETVPDTDKPEITAVGESLNLTKSQAKFLKRCLKLGKLLGVLDAPKFQKLKETLRASP